MAVTGVAAVVIGTVYVTYLVRRLRAYRLDAWRKLQRERGRFRG